MAKWLEYRAPQMSLDDEARHPVRYDSKIGDPKSRGHRVVPLAVYLNLDSVGRDGWEVCGVVPGGIYATIHASSTQLIRQITHNSFALSYCVIP